ncbi:RluA family pseudouridine synthase [Deinococcus metallilatus]|uniref:Pseudouridine synthase n=1 Tax=Deinococcus metallilatus TaxID=1211322 RepID=A0AAJ5F1P3_9DEIO|nr:RluA family pseudouridine synthase [Deinococcus metallilatus]QBY08354.1 RluA family pseudouridine synthase [Deinococcus metallilatus]RXJ11153.1 RluA family pseudouridine synthase [Deinococcus metallilatus]TLK24644.1 RluA family pseudouridine synthase [Deinococcus metallilatus]GMA17546.1 pseudouridine synthase [Deinococcus metallilatus]
MVKAASTATGGNGTLPAVTDRPPILDLTATPGRLDAVLADLAGVSRSQVAGWIAGGQVQVGGVVVQKASLKLRGGEALTVQVPPPPDATVAPEAVPLDVLYEDDHLIAVNKPPGMVTHPAPSVTSGTLVNALLGRMTLPEQPGAEGPDGYRPGIVHRLDKDTSGVIVVAKTVEAHARLAAAFKDRDTRKTYLAIAAGTWKAPGPVHVNAPIGRHPTARQRMTVGGASPREAQTLFTPLEAHPDGHGRTLALVRAQPRTGRTHQIRVHLAHLGSPILGDPVYGRESAVMPRHALHAHFLTLPHPVTGEPLHLHAPVPDDLLNAWVALGGTVPAELEVAPE